MGRFQPRLFSVQGSWARVPRKWFSSAPSPSPPMKQVIRKPNQRGAEDAGIPVLFHMVHAWLRASEFHHSSYDA